MVFIFNIRRLAIRKCYRKYFKYYAKKNPLDENRQGDFISNKISYLKLAWLKTKGAGFKNLKVISKPPLPELAVLSPERLKS